MAKKIQEIVRTEEKRPRPQTKVVASSALFQVSQGRARIERQAVTTEIAQVASYLQKHLGQRVTAYLSGVKDPKMVGQWASGKVQPRLLPQSRMRHAYQAARYLVEAYGDETAQAWFFGSNSQLDDEAPVYVLRHGNDPEDWRFVVSAAREFVENAR